MREAIGGTWIFQIVIFFILLFTGFMCLSINHSKAFNVKNMIVKEIERQEGIDLSNEKDPAIQKIVKYLKETSYRTTGKCPEGFHPFNRDGQLDSKNASFCLRAVSREAPRSPFGREIPTMTYYQVVVFYQLDLPIFNALFNFKVSGDTKIISGEVSK